MKISTKVEARLKKVEIDTRTEEQRLLDDIVEDLAIRARIKSPDDPVLEISQGLLYRYDELKAKRQ